MFPRVAFEYGHTTWALSTSACSRSRATPGTLMVSSTWIPKPVAIGPIPTRPVTWLSAGSAVYSWPATYFSALRKQAE